MKKTKGFSFPLFVLQKEEKGKREGDGSLGLMLEEKGNESLLVCFFRRRKEKGRLHARPLPPYWPTRSYSEEKGRSSKSSVNLTLPKKEGAGPLCLRQVKERGGRNLSATIRRHLQPRGKEKGEKYSSDSRHPDRGGGGERKKQEVLESFTFV